MNSKKTDEYYMSLALKEAQAAFQEEETPVGAVIVWADANGERVIAKAHNQRERLKDPTAHAEMIAITQAAEYLQNWRLSGCTLYVTIEPCVMCAGALVLARIDRLVFGASDPKAGACGSVFNVVNAPGWNHSVRVTSGVMAAECGGLLKEFFKARRQEQKTPWLG